jgi:branched-chain amino acid transport system ATP-binding protein
MKEAVASTVARGSRPEPALELRGITAGYGRTLVLREVDLVVPVGTVVALLGANSAGKTTLLRTAAGLLRPEKGTVYVGGVDVTKRGPSERAAAGLCLIPDGRGVFPSLTARENLLLALPPRGRSKSVEPALEVFPALKQHLSQKAGTLSGGEQRMLAMARCYLAHPSIVLLDEMSTGLAPRVIDQIFESLDRLIRSGVALLLVEQYLDRALQIADTVYLLSQGRIKFAGPAVDLDESMVLRVYLGAEPWASPAAS